MELPPVLSRQDAIFLFRGHSKRYIMPFFGNLTPHFLATLHNVGAYPFILNTEPYMTHPPPLHLCHVTHESPIGQTNNRIILVAIYHLPNNLYCSFRKKVTTFKKYIYLKHAPSCSPPPPDVECWGRTSSASA